MGEMTSLAKQLQKLAAPQTSLLVQGKIRQSFLFDPKEAASLDRDTVYSYGCTGLDKLVLVDPVFVRFRDSLFSLSAINFERSVQTAEVNKKLDQRISEFLTSLSPFFMLRGAHEALEWLIYRFHIHMFNVDALLACILPHYHTRVFVRALQLVNLKSESSRWYWLKSTQDSGKPLELSVLIHRMNSDKSFRDFIFELVPSIIRVYAKHANTASPVVSFSTVLAYYAVKRCQKIVQGYVVHYLPFIMAGLKSDVPSYIAGIYLTVSKLVVKIKLASEVLESFVHAICTNLLPSLTDQGLSLIALIFQHQEVTLTEKSYMALFENERVLSSLQSLSARYNLRQFSSSFAKQGISTAFSKQKENTSEKKVPEMLYAIDILNSADLEVTQVEQLFKHVIKWYIRLHKFHKKNSRRTVVLKQCGNALLKCIERRWPDAFCNAIELFSKDKTIGKEKKWAWNLINQSVVKVQHKIVKDAGLTMLLGVNHTNNAVREHSLTTLIENITSGKIECSDFLTETLLNCLRDENPKISLLALQLDNLLFEILPNDKLMSSLDAILKKGHLSGQTSVQLKVLELLFNQEADCGSLNLTLFEKVIPFLFLCSPKNVTSNQSIFKLPIADKHPILSYIKSECSSLFPDLTKNDETRHRFDFNCQILKALRKSILQWDEAQVLEFTSYFTQKHYSTGDSLLLLVILSMLDSVISSTNNKLPLSCLSDAVSFLKHSLSIGKIFYESCDTDADSMETICIKQLKKQKIPFLLLCSTFKSVIGNLPKMTSDIISSWWPTFEDSISSSTDGVLFELALDLFSFLMLNMSISSKASVSLSYKQLTGILLHHLFPMGQNLFWFLSYLWSSSLKDSYATVLQKISLEIAKPLVDKSDSSWVFNDTSKTFVSVLMAIYSPVENIRVEAMDFLQLLLLHCSDASLPFRLLGNAICSRYEEIKSDNNQLLHFVSTWFAPAFKSQTGSEVELKVLTNLLNLLSDSKTPCHVRHFLLLLLRDADSSKYLPTFIPLLKQYLETFYKNKSFREEQMEIIYLLLKKFSPSSAPTLIQESEHMTLLLSLIQCATNDPSVNADIAIQKLAIPVFTREFFMALPSTDVQQKVLDVLVTLYLNSESSEINQIVSSVLNKLCICAYLLLKNLPDEKVNTLSKDSLKNLKKSKTLDTFIPHDLDNISWKKIIVLLEIVQGKKKLKNREFLVSELFRILNLTLDWESNSQVEYLRQLILATIYNCCSHLESSEVDERKFQVEFIIHCIRSSKNPKTHHQALLLLNLAATMFPDYVLTNIMSIFTFMGSSLIRQDDSYSFQILSQTIETIIPAIKHASKQQNKNDGELMASIVRMFVDTLPDIPRHRHIPLFTKLIDTLGPSDYLWIPLAQVCERYAVPSVYLDIYTSSKRKNKHIAPIIEFSLMIVEHFPVTVQFETCIKLIRHLAWLPDYIRPGEESVHLVTKNEELFWIIEPFNLKIHNDQQLQEYKINTICYLNLWLSSESFIGQISELESQLTKLEPQYEELLESIMNYLQKICDSMKALEDNKLLSLLYDLLNHVNALLPHKLFFKVTKKLLANTMLIVQQKAIEMLNAKLEHQRAFFDVEDHRNLIKLMHPLLKILKEETEPITHNGTSKIVAINRQTAIFSLHLMSKIVGNEHSIKFRKVVPVLIDIIRLKSHNQLVINALLCLADLCHCLGATMLPHLNSFMPEILSLLDDEFLLAKNEYSALGLVSALHGIIESLGAFLSSHMESLVICVCNLAVRCEIMPKKSLQEKLESLVELIATEITPRVLLSSIQQSYEKILDKNTSAVSHLSILFRSHISKMSHVELEEYLPQLQNFSLSLLDFRNRNGTTKNPTVVKVEGEIIASLLAVIVKMSEPTFRTYFNNIYKWALPSMLENDAEVKELRVLTFYRLTFKLSESLKNLFVPCAKLFLRHAATLLDSINLSKVDTPSFNERDGEFVEILNYIIDSLNYCFMYDDGHLTEKDYFNVLMKPLVDQIENQLTPENVYQNFVENHLSHCIGHFVSAFSDSVLWKSLHYQVLLKTKDPSAKVRFAALQVIREIVNKMGENFLILLPESIPFLAEIMEDESFEVEQECQDVIANMEKILGEPIKKYF